MAEPIAMGRANISRCRQLQARERRLQQKENCLYSLAEREFSVSGLIRRDGEDARRGPTMFARISVARPPRSRPVTIRRATEKLRKEISSDDASARRPPWRSVG